MCEGASKQTLDLRILPRRDRPPPPSFEIPGSAPGTHRYISVAAKFCKFYRGDVNPQRPGFLNPPMFRPN